MQDILSKLEADSLCVIGQVFSYSLGGTSPVELVVTVMLLAPGNEQGALRYLVSLNRRASSWYPMVMSLDGFGRH